jgi:hypothetical protein
MIAAWLAERRPKREAASIVESDTWAAISFMFRGIHGNLNGDT